MENSHSKRHELLVCSCELCFYMSRMRHGKAHHDYDDHMSSHQHGVLHQHSVTSYIALRSVAVCCSVLQCLAVCCSVLQCVAVCCSVLQCVAVCGRVRQCVAVYCSDDMCTNSVAACCSLLQLVAACCSLLQCVTVATSTPCIAVRCNVVQCV